MMEPSVKERLQKAYQQLGREGKVLTRKQLEAYYGTFRDRFSPERLAKLDGEALLETMHLHANHDSLVYWLEFKDDEEFPARFGSIAGGSAYKFGLFRRKETETWETGSAKSPQELTVEQAIVIARKHRDQLLRGAELIAKLPANGTDEDYHLLQQQLSEAAPDVNDLAWGHKYFSLLFPEKIDDYHSPEWQWFHVLKMLQMPPEGWGRYLFAGRFVAGAAELGLPLNTFSSVLNAANGWRHDYWRVGTSNGAAPRNRWPLMRDNGCIAIGWDKLGDLEWLQSTKEARERLAQLLTDGYPGSPQITGRTRSQIVKFVAGMAEGDIVLAADGGTVLGIGRVRGPYAFDGSSDFPHRRPVEWLSLDEWKMPDPEGLRTTVHQMQASVNILEAERNIQGGSSVPKPLAVPSQGALKAGWPKLPGVIGHVQAILERKSLCILYGPPGTGKTYWAERAVNDLAAYWAFGQPFDALTVDDQRIVQGHDLDGLVRLCCFHPAYGYEDFIEGYRPEAVDGQLSFNLKDGVFKRLCQDAEKAPSRRFFLIVDEINRGDIPRIFGELLTILEKDKRGKAIALPVSGQRFSVPPNVFLVGTMNTADRSISLLDAALRRRFGFVELMPDSKVFQDHCVSGLPLGPWLDALNRRVCEHVGKDARNLQIGHSYLLPGGKPVNDLGALRRIVRDDILPLLEEYCYADFAALHRILGSGLIDLAGQRVRAELFEDGEEANLVQALLAPCPEITTSAPAITPSSEVEDDEADDDAEDAEQ